MQTFDAELFAKAIATAQWQRRQFCWVLTSDTRYSRLGAVTLTAPFRWHALSSSGEAATLDEAKAKVRECLTR